MEEAFDPMRERILRATFKVLCRHGYGKLNLSDVAVQAGISRPTFYKFFSSKDDLLSAFSSFELQLLREDLERAIEGRTGRQRVDALLRFLVDFYGSYQMRGLVEIEPGLVLGQMARALPSLVKVVAPTLAGEVSEAASRGDGAGRLSVCHYPWCPATTTWPVDRSTPCRRRCTVTGNGTCGTSSRQVAVITGGARGAGSPAPGEALVSRVPARPDRRRARRRRACGR
jgi:AcrR family transcriptional regulator